MGDSKEPWLTLDWDELQQDVESEDDARRFRAVVKAHAKVSMAQLLEIHWDHELRRAISDIRYRVVHCCHDPTLEEARHAVSTFRSLWEEKDRLVEKPTIRRGSFTTEDEIAMADELARRYQSPRQEVPVQRSYRILQFAQLMGVSSDTMLEMVRRCGIDAATPLYLLNAEQVARIRAEFEELKKL